jgi:hypothetical protein
LPPYGSIESIGLDIPHPLSVSLSVQLARQRPTLLTRPAVLRVRPAKPPTASLLKPRVLHARRATTSTAETASVSSEFSLFFVCENRRAVEPLALALSPSRLAMCACVSVRGCGDAVYITLRHLFLSLPLVPMLTRTLSLSGSLLTCRMPR